MHNVTTAVSTSPASPIAGSTITLAAANKPTGSSFNSQHAMSRSWIIMSRNIPPERRTEFDRRRRRIIARDAQDLGPVDGAGADLAFEPREIRIEAAVERDHQGHPACFGHGGASLGAAAVEIERLLAEDRLAGAGRRLDEIRVGVGRACDQDRID